MTLARATFPDGTPIDLPGDAPFPADALAPLMDVPFGLPPDDDWVEGGGDAAHAYLDGAREAWRAYPEWMDYLHIDSPANEVKRASRDLYLHWWGPWLDAGRVLDLGCGIGRITLPLLDRGATVWGIDADLLSLQRCAWRAPGRPGRLDLHWSSAHTLPEVGDLDLVVACEILCYVPDHEPVMRALVDRLKPGGALLIAMEAPYGWATSPDASPATLDHLTGVDRVIDLPGDRWVRTWSDGDLRALLEGHGLRVERMVPTHYVPDGPLESSAPEGLFLERLLEVEATLRAHPVWGPLNRVWTAVGVKS